MNREAQANILITCIEIVCQLADVLSTRRKIIAVGIADRIGFQFKIRIEIAIVAVWVEPHAAPIAARPCRVAIALRIEHGSPFPIETGTDGIVRYDRDGWQFTVRNHEGTQWLPGSSEKDFYGMYAAWQRSLERGALGEMPSAHDGLVATRIARRATEDVLRWHGHK